MKKGQVIENITEYMNNLGERKYTKFEVSAIRTSINKEFIERKKDSIKLNPRTKKNKKIINERVSKIVKRDFGFNTSACDIKLFKKCLVEEYQNRTGKCAWRYASAREHLGYDTITGLAIN